MFMSAEENRALARRFIEEFWSKGNLRIIDGTHGPNYVHHNLPPGVPTNKEGIRQMAAVFNTAFPDCRVTVEDVIAEGDKVVARWRLAGTHKGEFLGVPPTGRQANLTGIAIFRITGGKIAEQWENHDDLGLMQQLGAVPPHNKT